MKCRGAFPKLELRLKHLTRTLLPQASSGRSINQDKGVQCGACVAVCSAGAIDDNFCIDVSR